MSEHKKRRFVVALIVGALIALTVNHLFDRMKPKRSEQVPEHAPRTTQRISVSHLLDWARQETPLAYIDGAVDAFPNGLAISMAPLMVNWERSDWKSDNGAFIVHNVLIGGNPVNGLHVLGTVEVPVGGVESIEFVLVRDRRKEKDTQLGHGQLRFVFKENRRPRILTSLEMPPSWSPEIKDLVISWEAWREPRTPYTMQEGLTPGAYALSARCFSGAQSFLVGALKGKSWECYPVKLPEVPRAGDIILYTALMMGDGLARYMAAEWFRDDAASGALSSQLEELTVEELERVRDLFRADRVPENALAELMGKGEMDYNLVLRSCITQSLLALDLGFERIHDQYELGPRKRVKMAPKKIPGWIDDLVDDGKGPGLAMLPGALVWLAKNQTVLPAQAYRLLHDAGCLQVENGQPVVYRYAIEAQTPYGLLKENAM